MGGSGPTVVALVDEGLGNSSYLVDLGDGRALAIDRQELAARLEAGDVVVLDVRPTPEFTAGHIPGARSVPVAELRQQLRALPKDV